MEIELKKPWIIIGWVWIKTIQGDSFGIFNFSVILTPAIHSLNCFFPNIVPKSLVDEARLRFCPQEDLGTRLPVLFLPVKPVKPFIYKIKSFLASRRQCIKVRYKLRSTLISVLITKPQASIVSCFSLKNVTKCCPVPLLSWEPLAPPHKN